MRRWLLFSPLLVLGLAPPAGAQRAGPVLHEPVAADPREDVAMGLALDGDLPAALQTPRGLVAAPDPARAVGAGESPYSPKARNDDQGFRPDRDTSRPDLLPYDDPFRPSTAPFKRLSAFDAVDADYTLKVRDAGVAPLAVSALPSPDPSEELFYGDMVVELTPGRKVRIPSVGAASRVLHARAGVGTEDVPIRLSRDGAENWFVEGDTTAKVRLVMELAAPRATFGGDFGNPSWAQLPAVAPLPPAVERAATEVAARLGVSRAQAPRDVVAKLVGYFRSFVESEAPPTSSRDIYLDLALSRKGVCRHRAFAFLVTAAHLRLPTRMITNEAHAWVEVHDGRLWRRLDLGGAGRMLRDPGSRNVPYEAPPDPFAWPQGSTRGEDLGERTRHAKDAPFSGPGGALGGADAGAGSPNGPRRPDGRSPNGLPDTLDPNGTGAPGTGAPGDPRSTSGGGGARGSGGVPGRGALSGASGVGGAGGAVAPDDRPASTVTLAIAESDARRGAPMRIRGEVRADGEACGFVTVDVVLRSTAGELVIGQLATDGRGAYDGSIVLPSSVPLGDYELSARTFGDAKCGRSRGGAR
jgi:transglutaminase-like putative cysteine protease